jgi:hypothetical protein
MNLQLWDNSDYYCEKANIQRDWASSATTWTHTCAASGGDYYIVLTDNGRQGYVERRFTDGRFSQNFPAD